MKSGKVSFLLACVGFSISLTAGSAFAIPDGFGDGDRNNDGQITTYDSDTITKPLDPNDKGMIWMATFGHTPSGDRKSYITVIDDSTGDADSPGLQSGYALGCEGKGASTSFAGLLNDSVDLGPNVGDRVDVSFDFRGWSQSNNPTPVPVIGQLRFGIYEDTDNQFGKSADKGFKEATVIWGANTGQNDGDWKESDPGPVGDKGYYVNVPIGLAADPINGRIYYEKNQGRFLHGKDFALKNGESNDGDRFTVAEPNDSEQSPGGAIFKLFEPHAIKLTIVRATEGIELKAYFDGKQVLGNKIDPTNASVQKLGAPPETFDYIAFRHNEEWDMIIDNVVIKARSASE